MALELPRGRCDSHSYMPAGQLPLKISGHMAGMGGIVAVAFRIAAGSYYISAIWPWLAATVILRDA